MPEIMVPVVGMVSELDDQEKLAKKVYGEVCAKYKMRTIPHLYGTMIEIPRACLTAEKIAETAELFSFGTNDLTQMTFGFSRDDIGGFVPDYVEKKLLPLDPLPVPEHVAKRFHNQSPLDFEKLKGDPDHIAKETRSARLGQPG